MLEALSQALILLCNQFFLGIVFSTFNRDLLKDNFERLQEKFMTNPFSDILNVVKKWNKKKS